ncbi:MAG: MBL fold metallo-hydrolase [Planctomycetes bacterium]|nr:MBL fold metallo-hydrolase [Planctomycetota bacterium]
MPSHRLSRIEIDDLDILGYSIAGEETVVGMPQLDVCFDIGKAPDQIIPINNVLLTHGHMDHAAGIAYYLSHRKFCGQAPGTILFPENLLQPIQQIMEAWGRLDGNYIPGKLVGVKAGDEHPIKPNLFVRVFPTKHSRGSVGYTVIEKRKKLKPEYLELNGPQLVELKKQGIAIDNKMEIPIATYLGDTRYVDFSTLDYVAKSKILIAECTFFVDEHTERADAGRHMHVDEFVRLVDKLDNERIVITHMTRRTSMAEIRKILKKKLGKKIYEKTVLLMDARRSHR